jgi:hypothetical protein
VAIRDAIAGLATSTIDSEKGGNIQFTPAFSSQGLCTDTVQVVVPFRGNHSGRVAIRTKVSAAPTGQRRNGARDADLLRLTCRAAS